MAVLTFYCRICVLLSRKESTEHCQKFNAYRKQQTHQGTLKSLDNTDYNLIIPIQASLQKENEMVPEILCNFKRKETEAAF